MKTILSEYGIGSEDETEAIGAENEYENGTDAALIDDNPAEDDLDEEEDDE
jgi:hypothetical protein